MIYDPQYAPDSLKSLKPSGKELLEIGEFLVRYRKELKLTQYEAVRYLEIPYRRIQQCEAMAGWSKTNKDLICLHPEIFNFTTTMRLLRQSWGSQRSLGNEIKKLIESGYTRKKKGSKWSAFLNVERSHGYVVFRSNVDNSLSFIKDVEDKRIIKKWMKALCGKYSTKVVIN